MVGPKFLFHIECRISSLGYDLAEARLKERFFEKDEQNTELIV